MEHRTYVSLAFWSSLRAQPQETDGTLADMVPADSYLEEADKALDSIVEADPNNMAEAA